MKTIFLVSACLFLSTASIGQNQKEKLTREEKNEKNQARQERVNNKNDIALFKKQILGLREYANERKKMPELQKSSRMTVKVTAVIDTDAAENTPDSKTLIGYIKQDVGDNSTNMYELVYDRAQKRIISIKRTPEAIEADKEAAEEKEEKAANRKAPVKKATTKKQKDEDEDEDTDEEKPSRSKHKKDSDDE